VVEHRGVGAGELSAPVLAWFEEATGTPAGSIVFVGGFPWKGAWHPARQSDGCGTGYPGRLTCPDRADLLRAVRHVRNRGKAPC
jgi:hypothetical protein